MIDDVGDRWLDVPMDAVLPQPPAWPFAEPGALIALGPPVGEVRGAPSVGTVWTVGIAGGGVVERETVTALEVEASEVPPVGMVPRVGVMRWTEGVEDALGEPETSGNAGDSVPGAVGPLSPGPRSLPLPGLSPSKPAPSVGEFVASWRSPTS